MTIEVLSTMERPERPATSHGRTPLDWLEQAATVGIAAAVRNLLFPPRTRTHRYQCGTLTMDTVSQPGNDPGG